MIGLIFSIGLEFHVAKVLLKFHYDRINHVGVKEQRILKKVEKIVKLRFLNERSERSERSEDSISLHWKKKS